MPTSDLSPIEMKKTNISKTENTNHSDWAKFGKSMIYNVMTNNK